MTLFFLLIYFLVIIVVIEIHVILFRLTGLKVEISRFQVISLMTCTGFTTVEAELILGHPVRRKLAGFLILFGAFSLAVFISSISNFLSNELRTKQILYLSGGVLLAFAALKLAFVQKLLSRLFNRKMEQTIQLGDLPIREVFLTNNEDHVLNLHIFKESFLVDHTLNQVINDELDFAVLFIKRGDLIKRKNIYDTKINEGDQIFLFGDKGVILEIFKHDIKIMEEKLQNQLFTPVDEQ